MVYTIISSWDSVDRQSLLEDGWEENADTLLGIKLYPSGEYNAIEFMEKLSGDMEAMYSFYFSTGRQTITNAICTLLFFRNLRISIRMIAMRPNALVGWCCAMQSIVGLIMMFACLSIVFPSGCSCRELTWIGSVCLTISAWCTGSVLLQKAYLVHDRNRWLLTIGIILLLPQMYTCYIFWTTPIIMHPSFSCFMVYSDSFPVIKAAIDIPINVIFSVIFIRVVYQQYRKFGADAWARLAREGIQTMCMVVAVNISCMLIVLFELLGTFSSHFIIIDSIVTSVLLVYHCSTMLETSSQYANVYAASLSSR
jgi:hypothetical protein